MRALVIIFVLIKIPIIITALNKPQILKIQSQERINLIKNYGCEISKTRYSFK